MPRVEPDRQIKRLRRCDCAVTVAVTVSYFRCDTEYCDLTPKLWLLWLILVTIEFMVKWLC